jgi:hypothetical protein
MHHSFVVQSREVINKHSPPTREEEPKKMQGHQVIATKSLLIHNSVFSFSPALITNPVQISSWQDASCDLCEDIV